MFDFGSVVEGVALLAEGVDRNSKRSNPAAQGDKSPSSRRAWIEIMVGDRVAKLQAENLGSVKSKLERVLSGDCKRIAVE